MRKCYLFQFTPKTILEFSAARFLMMCSFILYWSDCFLNREFFYFGERGGGWRKPHSKKCLNLQNRIVRNIGLKFKKLLLFWSYHIQHGEDKGEGVLHIPFSKNVTKSAGSPLFASKAVWHFKAFASFYLSVLGTIRIVGRRET